MENYWQARFNNLIAEGLNEEEAYAKVYDEYGALLKSMKNFIAKFKEKRKEDQNGRN